MDVGAAMSGVRTEDMSSGNVDDQVEGVFKNRQTHEFRASTGGGRACRRSGRIVVVLQRRRGNLGRWKLLLRDAKGLASGRHPSRRSPS